MSGVVIAINTLYILKEREIYIKAVIDTQINHHQQVIWYLLINTGGRAHGSLDEERLDVLPVLFEERDEEVDAQHGVCNEFIVGHFDVTDGDTQAENLFKLEFDGGLGFFDLDGHVIRVRNGGGELTGLVQTGTQETRNLFDDDIGSEEEIVRGSELLDFLLSLLEFLQIFSRTEIDSELFGLIAVDFITQNANLQTGTGGVGQTDGSRETLVVLDVVVLQTDLEFNSFGEVALGFRCIGNGQHVVNGLTNGSSGNFAIKWS
jgi:hypothetical protein